MHVLPWLLPMMIAHASGRQVQEAPGILAAIDAGLPLFDAVASAYNVPREVVRWLGRRSLPANWIVDAPHLQRLLAVLSWLAPEQRPRDLTGYADLAALAQSLSAPLDFCGEMKQAAALVRIAPCMRRWLAQGRQADVASLRARWARCAPIP